METILKILAGVAIVIFAIAFGVGLAAVCAWVFMALWNYVVPEVFHGPVLQFWQAWALMLLIGLIRGGAAYGSKKG